MLLTAGSRRSPREDVVDRSISRPPGAARGSFSFSIDVGFHLSGDHFPGPVGVGRARLKEKTNCHRYTCPRLSSASSNRNEFAAIRTWHRYKRYPVLLPSTTFSSRRDIGFSSNTTQKLFCCIETRPTAWRLTESSAFEALTLYLRCPSSNGEK